MRENLEKLQALRMKSRAERRSVKRHKKKGSTVRFITLLDICKFKNSEFEQQFLNSQELGTTTLDLTLFSRSRVRQHRK